MTSVAKKETSLKALQANDAEAKKVDSAKFTELPSASLIRATVVALEAKKHKVSVVADAKQARELLAVLVPANSSVGLAGSTTLSEIGFTDYLKTERKDITNYADQAAEAMAAGDMAGYSRAKKLGSIGDVFFSSCAAITQTGELVSGDASGTRLGGWLLAKQVVVVASANKIVASLDEAIARLETFQLPIESARLRTANGIPASSLNNELIIKNGSSWAPNRFHVVIITDRAYGF